jgi:hypothetical protein
LEDDGVSRIIFVWFEAGRSAGAGGAAAILISCAILAGYAAAWLASRIDPMTALRHE